MNQPATPPPTSVAVCSGCGYDLHGLTADMCPECNTSAVLLPVCLGCGYDVAGIRSDACPECGEPLATMREIAAARAALLANRGELLKKALFGWGTVITIYTLGVACLTGEGESFIAAAIVLLLAPLLTEAAGRLALMAFSRPERTIATTVWTCTNWILQVPWLCIPICAAVALLAALLGSQAYDYICMAGFLIWLLVCPASLITWAAVFARCLARLRVRQGLRAVPLHLTAPIVLAGAMPLGFAGGALAALSIGEWFGILW